MLVNINRIPSLAFLQLRWSNAMQEQIIKNVGNKGALFSIYMRLPPEPRFDTAKTFR